MIYLNTTGRLCTLLWIAREMKLSLICMHVRLETTAVK